eukprot:CAMPEP_0169299658 /NCGR_PEP_ID=MMETSP1016-20121227/67183_1 /TAXON_ID=342587 /ORGANISM="Karlodinium micrum, Strain CCMP2283" /LENGTH=44 /DNA_ID= /DNA_START= /DNA_END= /DNA_ORIENTATION=
MAKRALRALRFRRITLTFASSQEKAQGKCGKSWHGGVTTSWKLQ